jgi:hypothetical protein
LGSCICYTGAFPAPIKVLIALDIGVGEDRDRGGTVDDLILVLTLFCISDFLLNCKQLTCISVSHRTNKLLFKYFMLRSLDFLLGLSWIISRRKTNGIG